MPRYVALLRGINVGGKNVIRMTDLRACFEKNGFADVVTYIQSGNVLFTPARTERGLVERVEGLLGAAFGYKASVVLRTLKQMEEIVERAPKGFGTDQARYRYDVIFLKEPLDAATALKSVAVKEGVDQAHAGESVLYFSRLDSRASQSHLPKLVSRPVYKSMTIRNWNTTTKLLELMK
ncbi:MAG: DUF1697 domain-containing protein [Gemmatimonadaceae bacterium]